MTMTPYQPMHPPQRAVSHEEMMATLKRRVRESVEKHARNQSGAVTLTESIADRDSAAELPQPSPVLSWLKPVRNSDQTGYLESTCKVFVVGKAFVNGVAKYTASKRVKDLWVWAMETFDTAAEAQARCEAEARK